MKHDILKQYTKLRTSLEQERAEIQTRLSEIDAALGTEAASEPASTPEAPLRRGPGRPKGSKRKMTPANKAKLIAGIKARWAKYRAQKAGKAVAAPKPAAKTKKFFSPAARARLAAAAKARWAKAKATGKGKL
jgi:hypothetical protein